MELLISLVVLFGCFRFLNKGLLDTLIGMVWALAVVYSSVSIIGSLAKIFGASI